MPLLVLFFDLLDVSHRDAKRKQRSDRYEGKENSMRASFSQTRVFPPRYASICLCLLEHI